ncbi:MAG: TOMM propeptide domain-containing protein [Bacteroidota bacterium]
MELTKNQKIISQLFERSWADPAFKEKLVANPEDTIRAATGDSLDLPKGKTLVVVDQSDSSKVYLNIPAELDMDEIELTDEQLELIAGGSSVADAAAANVKSP